MVTHSIADAAPAHAYSIKRFAQLFSIGRSSIYDEIRAGRLKVRKVGKRTLITHDDAMTWLAALPAQMAKAR